MKLSIFFPCHNEAQNIKRLLEKTTLFAQQYLEDYEIIVVDDGSRDDTAQIAEKYSKEADNHVTVIRHGNNKGYGGALQTGFANAKLPFVFYTDGDGQFDIFELKEHLSEIHQGQVLSAYRAKRYDPFFRKVNAFIFNSAVNFVFGLWLRDVDCAFKVYPQEVIGPMNLQSQGAMIDSEMLIKSKKLGCRIKQFSVTHYPRQHGHATGAKLSVIFKAMFEFVGLWMHIHQWKSGLRK